VRYVGSPYEISLAEAGQQKTLLVLDSSQNWKVVDTIPLEGIGSRHYRFKSMTEFLSNDFSPPLAGNNSITAATMGDARQQQQQQLNQHRVVVSVSQQELADMRNIYNTTISSNSSVGGEVLCPFDAKVKLLRKLGAKVEIREEVVASTADQEDISLSSSIPIEDMTPTDVMSFYFTDQVNSNRLSNHTATRLLEAGTLLIEDVLNNSENSTANTIMNMNPTSAAVREIDFHSVTIEGYGSFKDVISYPLMDRGLVLIRGSNLDGGYDRCAYIESWSRHILTTVSYFIFVFRVFFRHRK
jgi:predicted DNA-binding protein YlxM (UPF0122 family)